MTPFEMLQKIADSHTVYDGPYKRVLINNETWEALQEWANKRRDKEICPSCSCPINPGTYHTPFNGNQMFACEIVVGTKSDYSNIGPISNF